MRLSEEHTYKVRLHHQDLGDLGEARLTFGGERSVTADIGLLSRNAALEAHESLEFVSAKSEDGRTFTLCDCTVHGFAIYAVYLICGDVTANCFQQIDVRYSDISEWFLHKQRIEGNVGEQLKWTAMAQQFSVEIAEDTRQFVLSSNYVSSRDQIGEDHILHEHIEFSFQPRQGEFRLEDISTKTRELGALLSLLIAYPISLISVTVSTEPDRFYWVYFATFKPLARKDTQDFAYQCFLQKHVLDGRWELILQNYYQNAKRRKLWVRLAGMQRYEGFWEFRLLGYVSLLDKYVSRRASNASFPGKPDEFEAELRKVSPELDTTTMKAIVAAARRIWPYQDSTFAEKYAYSVEQTDNDVIKFIDITENDFKLIKKIRDRIAHGEEPGIADGEFTRITHIVGKITLLLTYWSLIDLGLIVDDFLKALNTTRSKMRFAAAFNEQHLARVTNPKIFLRASEKQFQILLSRKDLHAFPCFIKDQAGEVEISEPYSGVWRAWHMTPARNSAMTSYHDIFQVDEGVVEFEQTVYVECNAESMKLHTVCLFDKSKLAPV
jgi:hypothetical protein